MTPVSETNCPLCESPRVAEFWRDAERTFFRCGVCSLVFADPQTLPTREEERRRYDQHRNSPSDPGYRQFLGRLAEPLAARLKSTDQHGLDFGSGPGPTLSLMLEAMGFAMTVYDPHYAPDPSVLTRHYDFVTCSEAIEHFHRPAREWRLLTDLVKPGGWLGIMTKLVLDAGRFATWHYKNDHTHVSFFSRETFVYLAERDGLECEFVADDVILLRKPSQSIAQQPEQYTETKR